LLSEIVSSEKEPKELRVQAANFLLPYKYGKCGALTPLRYISEPVALPRPTTIEQANANIALISDMKTQGQIDLDFADSLIADNRTIANNIIAEEELKLKIAAQGPTGELSIRIEGGLPELPGTNISMPHMNGVNGQGHALNGHGPVIDHQPPKESILPHFLHVGSKPQPPHGPRPAARDNEREAVS
jgi:hypothetical protein